VPDGSGAFEQRAMKFDSGATDGGGPGSTPATTPAAPPDRPPGA
jgi:hypothetical protein